MQKENLFISWVILLIIEIGWLYGITHNVHSTGDLAFVIGVIIVTVAIGAVGINLFGK